MCYISTSFMSQWWRTTVIYQIYPRSFQDSNHDGIGDIKGIIQRLPYLRDLGIGAIWISPFFKSPQVDHGYDITDYCDIDPIFGTMQEFEEMLQKFHDANIKVILDLVLNHTSDQHPWFIEARASKASPKHDWYIWHDGPKPPNNWICNFTLGTAWHKNEATNELFLGQFTPQQPEVNWLNPDLRAEMYKVVRFWLDKGADGFRLDVANFYVKDTMKRSNPRSINVHPSMFFMKHLYDRNRPEMLEIHKELRAICNSYPGDRALIGEIFDEDPNVAASCQGQNDGLNMAFNFDFFFQKCSARSFRQSAQSHYACIAAQSPENQPCFTLSNHDQHRFATRYHERDPVQQLAKMKMLAAMLLTLRGTPFLYYGEEVGMENVKVPKQQRQDPMKNGNAIISMFYRDPERTPMQWGEHEFTDSVPWLPIGDERACSVQQQLQSETSLLSVYKRLLRLRAAQPELNQGSILFMGDDSNVMDFVREFEGGRVRVVLNFGSAIVIQCAGEVLFQSGLLDGSVLRQYGVAIVKEQ